MPVPLRRRLLAADGTVLAARYLPGPPAAPGLVLGHGFTGSWERPEQSWIAERLTGAFGVVAVDLRGHGSSGGASTLGHREVLDVEAAVAWARLLGHTSVVTLGFSMGGGAVVRHAAEFAGVAAVAAVSAPARWHYLGTRPMRIAHWAVGGPSRRRLLAEVRGTRVNMAVWDTLPWPPDPRTAAQSLTMPLLVVHGDADHYFPLDHATDLAAGPTAESWLLPGLGHAENAVDGPLIDRIGEWLITRCRDADAGLP